MVLDLLTDFGVCVWVFFDVLFGIGTAPEVGFLVGDSRFCSRDGEGDLIIFRFI